MGGGSWVIPCVLLVFLVLLILVVSPARAGHVRVLSAGRDDPSGFVHRFRRSVNSISIPKW